MEIKKILLMLFASTTLANVFCQKQLSKKEILNYWKERFICNETQKTDFVPDMNLNQKINKVLDSLGANNIDTVGFFVKYLPGFIATDTCTRGVYPSYIYFFWKSNNQIFQENIQNHCESSFKPTFSFFNYYEENIDAINDYHLMPFILQACLDTSNILRYSNKLVSHESKYVIYCRFKSRIFLTKFGQVDIEDTDSLFFNDNVNSKTYQWFKLVNDRVTRK